MVRRLTRFRTYGIALLAGFAASAGPASCASVDPSQVVAIESSPQAASSPAPARGEMPYVRNWLMSGFFTKHFADDARLEDYNAGVFLEHDFNRRWGFFAGAYENSGFVLSRIFAVDYEPLHVGRASTGLLAGAIDGYMQLNHGHLFAPAGLPFVAYATDRFKARLFCLPEVIKTAEGFCAIQFGVDLGDSKLDL